MVTVPEKTWMPLLRLLQQPIIAQVRQPWMHKLRQVVGSFQQVTLLATTLL